MPRFNEENLTDAELLARFEQGRDQSAFTELVCRHGAMVMATCRRALINRTDAEDAFQATFFALAKGIGGIRQKSLVAAWLYQTAKRTSSSILRARKRHDAKIQGFHATAVTTDSNKGPMKSAIDTELAAILDEEIAKLPPKLRAVVVLCHLEGLNMQQVAGQLGVASSTVHERLAKSRSLLKYQLMRRGVTATLTGLSAVMVSSTNECAAMVTERSASVTEQSSRFAAGEIASSAKSTVIKAAEKQLATLAWRKYVALTLAALSLVLVGSIGYATVAVLNTTKPVTVFYDDFGDGSTTNNTPQDRDGNAIVWRELNGFDDGRFDATSHGYQLQTNRRGVIMSRASISPLQDMSVRAQLRLISGQGAMGIVVRGESSGPAGYEAGVDTRDRVAYIVTIDSKGAASMLCESPLRVNPKTTDVMLQIDAFGNSLKLFIWPVGESKPHAPLLVALDSQHSMGTVGVTLDDGRLLPKVAPAPATGSFRFIHVADTSINDSARSPVNAAAKD